MLVSPGLWPDLLEKLWQLHEENQRVANLATLLSLRMKTIRSWQSMPCQRFIGHVESVLANWRQDVKCIFA